MTMMYLFLPKRRHYHLPKGATILDVAFKIHTDIGLKFKAGIVNGRIVPINYILKNGTKSIFKHEKNLMT